jgi:recombinational DNA repair protein RecR
MITCSICNGFPKSARCPFCQTRRKLKRDMTRMEIVQRDALIEHEEYLRITFLKLKKYKMKTTQNAALDEEVRQKFGNWLS